MTVIQPKPRQFAALRMRGVAGVARGANRTQLTDEDGKPADGWVIIKMDGTPVEDIPNARASAVQRAERAERDLADARAELDVLRARSAATVTKSAAWAKIEKAARELVATTDPDLTLAQAIDRVTCSRPELAAAYRDATPDPVPVIRAAPVPAVSGAWAAIAKAADRVRVHEPALTVEQAVDRAVQHDPGPEGRIRRRAPRAVTVAAVGERPAVASGAAWSLLAELAAADWTRHAACARSDPALFFPETGESPVEARAICARCPVRDNCLEYALARNERHGVWGGTTPHERYRLSAARRERRAGRSHAGEVRD